ncbi:2OG-Fe(II) oxygenase [Arenicella xantha]|uniref:SM-20-related protein n=1 Tax=Arenicella xantha TaxID=644221 RepID=A0A395JG27_9GAMM|nr:2OG-Fe(II) oxygenase [Arenicella xantha]RBP48732.1 SM-20-related protein [Arenicella xantha]
MFDVLSNTSQSAANDEALFAQIATDLQINGYSINYGALPNDLTASLLLHLKHMDSAKFEQAGIGRDQAFTRDDSVRRDEICWITGESDAGRNWLDWMQAMRIFLNRRLFLGLFSFESHFAHYAKGDFYKRHVDAFKGDDNRVLSVAVYLNQDWLPDAGGELVIYNDDNDQQGIKVAPTYGTIALFLSEEFPHEVTVTQTDRYSIAGWFRVNTSTAARVDPPR